MANSEPSKAVVKTLKLLEVLSNGDSIGITELSQQVAMHKSTVYRFMATLCELGYARQDDTERYSGTLKMLQLGNQLVQNQLLWRYAKEIMEALSIKTRETIHLATIEDYRLIYVHKIESTQSLRVSMMSQIGYTAPFHCTGVGKVLLAFTTPGIREAILQENPLDRFTDNTITSKELLLKELEQIRQTGISIDDEEHESGVRCLAVPIWKEPGRSVIAALSISAPAIRMEKNQRQVYEEMLFSAAKEIATRLGLVETPSNSIYQLHV